MWSFTLLSLGCCSPGTNWNQQPIFESQSKRNRRTPIVLPNHWVVCEAQLIVGWCRWSRFRRWIWFCLRQCRVHVLQHLCNLWSLRQWPRNVERPHHLKLRIEVPRTWTRIQDRIPWWCYSLCFQWSGRSCFPQHQRMHQCLLPRGPQRHQFHHHPHHSWHLPKEYHHSQHNVVIHRWRKLSRSLLEIITWSKMILFLDWQPLLRNTHQMLLP